MVISDAGKLGLLLTVILGCFALVLFDKATLTDVAPYLTLVVGFLVGNGTNAVRRHAPSSVIVPPIKQDEVLTIDGAYPASLEKQTSDS